MKPDRLRWWPFFLLFVACTQALPQAITASNDGSGDAPDIYATAHFVAPEPSWVAPEPALVAAEPASDGQASSPAPERPYGWRIAIYPAMAWVPIFGTSVTLPPLPSHPTAPGPSGSTSSSFNGAYFGGARLERGKWSADALFMWTALSASRTTPFVNVNLDFIFGDAHIGREVLPNLYLEGGFRRLALDFTAKVETDSGSASPGFWDPLIGLTYRRPLGKKWRILIHGDGGGFGVGTDVDVAATGRAEWQIARHFGMTMGYGGMHFSEGSRGPRGKLSINPTMHGPIVGFGMWF